ncbi:helix-turn-helix domain-containing protein, partial [Mycolicibacterium mucogenicum]|uniref:helix-turn-helix domain-containing protein n=1 Tax=Mycolicibacterium mucogenicum TaxID=56689 RepID=UPI001F318DF3
MRAKGIRATTVSEVAEAAGVSRGWLYRHFPDKVTLLGAAIVRLNNAYWTDAHAMLASIEGLDNQIVTGIQHGRTGAGGELVGLLDAQLHQQRAGVVMGGAAV